MLPLLTPDQPSAAVLGALPGTSVVLEPGKRYLPLPLAVCPPSALGQLVPAGDGTFRFVAQIMPRWFVLNAKTLRLLGIPCSQRTLLRLMIAGFIETRRPAPNTREFSYDAYLAHAEASRDPEFWHRIQPGHRYTNLQRFRQAL